MNNCIEGRHNWEFARGFNTFVRFLEETVSSKSLLKSERIDRFSQESFEIYLNMSFVKLYICRLTQCEGIFCSTESS